MEESNDLSFQPNTDDSYVIKDQSSTIQFTPTRNQDMDLSIVEEPQEVVSESRRSRVQSIKMERRNKGWNSNFGCKCFFN